MSGTGGGYDLSPSTFSPDGRIFQVEYAHKAVENSGNAIGIRCTDGILLAVEKILLSKMLVPGTSRRIHHADLHIGLALSGLIADGRQLVNRAREECRVYKDNYGSPISPKVLTDRMSQYVHYFTLTGALRPFGCSVLIAGYDSESNQHELGMIEPSGVSWRYRGCAIGKGRNAAQTEIEKLKLFDMTCREAMKYLAKIMHVLHDEMKDKPFELEMSWLCKESEWKHERISQELIDEAEKWARNAIEEDEMDEDDDDDDDE